MEDDVGRQVVRAGEVHRRDHIGRISRRDSVSARRRRPGIQPAGNLCAAWLVADEIGIAKIAEELGVLERGRVSKEIKSFSQEDRAALRKLGVRFGAYHLYLPLLLKPAPRTLAALLWALRHGGLENIKGLEEAPHLAASGRTSFAADPAIAKGFYRAAGYRLCGERVVRVDILERLADLIRPAIAYRPGVSVGEPPAGAADADGFVVTVAMTSLTGCAGDAFSSILRSLGYANAKRPGPAINPPRANRPRQFPRRKPRSRRPKRSKASRASPPRPRKRRRRRPPRPSPPRKRPFLSRNKSRLRAPCPRKLQWWKPPKRPC